MSKNILINESSNQNFLKFFNTIKELLFILDMKGNILHVNKTVEDRLGYTLAELVNESVLIVHPKDRWDEAQQNVVDMLQGTVEFCPIPLRKKNGELIPVETRVCVGEWDGQDVLYGVSKDISDLQLSEEKFSKIFQTSPSLMAISSLEDDKILDVNQTFCDVLGLKKDNIIGKTANELGIFVNPEDRIKALAQMRTERNLKNLEVDIKTKNGAKRTGLFGTSTIHVGDTKVLLTTMNDITEIKHLQEDIKQYNLALEELVEQKIKKIEYLGIHDEVTGLGNQNALNNKFETQSKENYTLGNKSGLYIRLENFKHISDSIGYKESNKLLIELVQEMQTAIGRWGILYRTSTNEFVAIINSNNPEFVVEIARKVRQTLIKQININGKMITIITSIGVGIGLLEDSLSIAVRKASIAVDFGSLGEHGIQVYSPEMESTMMRGIQLEADMKMALENHEFEMYFQPIFDARKGIISHVEALLRWNHPELGLISPAEFIPIAEKTRKIIPITEWIIGDVCNTLAKWKKLGLDSIMVGINLSLISLEKRHEQFIEDVKQQIHRSGTNPNSLIFEITESTLLNDIKGIRATAEKLKEIGIRLALDDFGTGYSAFSCLNDIPLDIVKIDRSLIQNLVENKKNRTMISSLIQILHSLDMEAVVEGVETSEQFNVLVDDGCDYIQGYLFSKPLEANAFIDYYFDTKVTKKWL